MGLEVKKKKKYNKKNPSAHTCLHTATQFVWDEKTKLNFKAGIFLSVALELLAFSEASWMSLLFAHTMRIKPQPHIIAILG